MSTETVPSSGLDATQNAASAGGDKVTPGSIIRVVNGGASPVDVTLVIHQTVDVDLDVPDRVVTVPDGEFRYIRVTDIYRNPADGLVDITWEATTSVTFEVIK